MKDRPKATWLGWVMLVILIGLVSYVVVDQVQDHYSKKIAAQTTAAYQQGALDAVSQVYQATESCGTYTIQAETPRVVIDKRCMGVN